ncbi:MAG: hypothetical protein QW328_07120 [Nitrososphaerota archaeon]
MKRDKGACQADTRKPSTTCFQIEPVTPNEIAKRLGISFKTVKDVLMHLAVIKRGVRYKNSGRIHIFWREKLDAQNK